MDVLVDWVLKDCYLHFTLWLLRNVYYVDKGSSSSVCQVVARVTPTSMAKVYQQCWKEWEGWRDQEGVPDSVISAPQLADFLLPLFRIGLTKHIIGILLSSYFSLFGTSSSSS